MAATLASAWLVAAQSKNHRQVGFWVFNASNVFWITWLLTAIGHDRKREIIAIAAMEACPKPKPLTLYSK
jgi:hypothetical protein